MIPLEVIRLKIFSGALFQVLFNRLFKSYLLIAVTFSKENSFIIHDVGSDDASVKSPAFPFKVLDLIVELWPVYGVHIPRLAVVIVVLVIDLLGFESRV